MIDAKTEVRRAAIVTVEYPSSTNELEMLTGKVAVPAHLLWSPEGMAVLFTKLREDNLGRRHQRDALEWNDVGGAGRFGICGWSLRFTEHGVRGCFDRDACTVKCV
jgi:hypothetical protein